MATTPRNLSVLFILAVGLAAPCAAQRPQPIFLREWTMRSGCGLDPGGDRISTATYSPSDWHKVAVPSTVVAGLVADKTLPDPYYGTNITSLAGYVSKFDFANFDMPAD